MSSFIHYLRFCILRRYATLGYVISLVCLMSSSSCCITIFRSQVESLWQSLLANESQLPTWRFLTDASVSWPKKEENKLLTGLTINSVAGTCTEKLFATLLRRTFSSVVISIDQLLVDILSETKGLTVTVKSAFKLSLVIKLACRFSSISSHSFFSDVCLLEISEAGS